MVEYSDPSPDTPPNVCTDAELESNRLYAVLSYRGDLAAWNWAFFVPNSSFTPIGSSGTLFHVINSADSSAEWAFEAETKDIVSSPLLVAIVRLGDVGFLGTYEDIVGQDSLLPMFRTVAIPAIGSTIHPAEFSSRTWFLDAICVLHDCGVVTCDDVWLLEREIRRFAFTAMDKYLQNKDTAAVYEGLDITLTRADLFNSQKTLLDSFDRSFSGAHAFGQSSFLFRAPWD